MGQQFLSRDPKGKSVAASDAVQLKETSEVDFSDAISLQDAPGAGNSFARNLVEGSSPDQETRVADPVDIAQRGVAGGGDEIPYAEAIQASFGAHDISGIRAHQGGQAQQAAQSMGAKAYATGSDVAFASAPDLHTAAHEAAHVVQQQGGVSLKDGMGKVGDHYEQHADKVADAVVQGKSAEGLLDPMARGGGSSAVQRKDAVVQRKEEPGANNKEPKSVIGFVGLSGYNEQERRAMAKSSPDEVVSIINDKKQTEEMQNATPSELLIKLGIDATQHPEMAEKAKHCLRSCDVLFKDQMFKMLQLFLRAEMGEVRLERLVLSGHSGGSAVSGEDDTSGQLDLQSDLRNISDTFPKAAAQVQDLKLAACNSFSPNSLKNWYKTFFPNLKTFWAYGGIGPGLGTKSPEHMKEWEKRTRGDKDTLSRPPSKGLGPRAKNIGVWSEKGGLEMSKSTQIQVLMDSVYRLESLAQQRARETDKEWKPSDEPFLEYYLTVQEALRHPELDEHDEMHLQDQKDTALRLRYYYKSVRAHVAKQHQAELNQHIQFFNDNIDQLLPDGHKFSGIDIATAPYKDILLFSDRLDDIYEYMWNHEDHPLQQKVDDIWAFVDSKLVRMQEISLAQVTTH